MYLVLASLNKKKIFASLKRKKNSIPTFVQSPKSAIRLTFDAGRWGFNKF